MSWKRAFLVIVVVAPVLGLFAYGLSRDARLIPSPLPGRDAPLFQLAVLDGTGALLEGEDTVHLEAFLGDVVVVNFWASWCLACIDEHGPLTSVAREYRGRGVHFLGIVYKDSPESASRWLRRMGDKGYPIGLDPRSRTAIDYGLVAVPETFFIGRDGRVAYKHVGPVTRELLVNQIETLLAQDPAPVTEPPTS